MSNDSYFADNIALAHAIPMENLSNADVDLDRAAIRFIIDQVKLAKEQLVVGKVMATSTWGSGTDWAGVASGNAYGSATILQWHVSGNAPVYDCHMMIRSVRQRCRRPANRIVMSEDVAIAACNSADTKARLNYVERGTVTFAQLQDLIFPGGTGRLVVPQANYNSAAEGQTAVYTDLTTSGYMWVGYVNDIPDATGDAPSAGYQFVWKPLGADQGGIYILPPKDENDAGSNHVRIYEGGYFCDAKNVSTACGLLCTTILG